MESQFWRLTYLDASSVFLWPNLGSLNRKVVSPSAHPEKALNAHAKEAGVCTGVLVGIEFNNSPNERSSLHDLSIRNKIRIAVDNSKTP